MSDVCEFVNSIKSCMPSAIIIEDDNPIDSTTPVGIPLGVVGCGFNGAGIDYNNVKGFDQISKTEEDQYYIVSNGILAWVIRAGLSHNKLWTESSIDYHSSMYLEY